MAAPPGRLSGEFSTKRFSGVAKQDAETLLLEVAITGQHFGQAFAPHGLH